MVQKWGKVGKSGSTKRKGGVDVFGSYQHSLDTKGRLFIPAKMREELGEAFYVTISTERCLTAYTEEGWQDLMRRVRALPKMSQYKMRPLFAQAERCELDNQGRILLPLRLREHAGLKKNVTIVGMMDEAQFWDSDVYAGIEAQEETPENVAEIFRTLEL